MDIQEILMQGCDHLVECFWPAVNKEQAAKLRGLISSAVVGHRGDSVDGKHAENSLASFSQATESRSWGIEFDVWWTLDGIPVIHHDRSLRRIFQIDKRISECAYEDIRHLVPTVDELVLAQANRQHLMVEIKDLPKDPVPAIARLRTALKDSQYHLMSFRLDHLLEIEKTGLFSPSSLLPIAEMNVSECSSLALERNWGGITGHYLLISKKLIDRHHAQGQKVGTGFINTVKKFWHEYQRGVDWFFSDSPTILSRDLNKI